jgi:hypothetical protein
MTSDSDDLDQQLRQNLKLRRELADAVAKAKQGGGMASRLGWVLYWTCLALAAVWVLWSLLLVSDSNGGVLGWAADVIPRNPFGFLLWFSPALALYGLGRAFRYVLSGE